MKNGNLFLSALFVFFLFTLVSGSGITVTWDQVLYDNCPIENVEKAYITAAILNNGDSPVEMTYVRFHWVVGGQIESYSHQFSVSGVVLEAKEVTTVKSVATTFPEVPSTEPIGVYIEAKGVERGWWSTDVEDTTQINGIVTVIANQDHECNSNSDCASSEYCRDAGNCHTSCEPVVSLSSCGYVENHAWKNYECCQVSDCADSKTCSGHQCVSVPCQCGSVTNHQCNKYECCSNSECAYNQHCENHRCIDWECMTNDDCSDTEKCTNHECVAVSGCGLCEYASKHQCMKYSCCSDSACKDNEYCDKNTHSCQILMCQYKEVPKQHKCSAVSCVVTSDCPSDSTCENNNCVQLQCGDCEEAKLHACVPLHCTSNERCENHKCISLTTGAESTPGSGFSTPSGSAVAGDQSGSPILMIVLIGCIAVAAILTVAYFYKNQGVGKGSDKKKSAAKTETRAVSFCPTCGAQVTRGEFCRNCGLKLT